MRVLDTTLREGCQRWGVYFSFKTKKKILTYLSKIGIEEVEVGVVGEEGLKKLVTFAKALFSEDKVSVWLRLKEEDIKRGAKLGVGLNIGTPVSKIHLEKRLKVNEKEFFLRLEKLVKLAVKASPLVTLGLEDSSRAEKKFVFEVCGLASSLGVKRIRISDTLGIFNPLTLAKLVREVKTEFPELEIGFHGHNDFGMATANSLTALISGADWVDVSVLGMGERAGIAPLEQVITYLCFYHDKSYDLRLLPKLCHYVALKAKQSISDFSPILGKKLFYCESGLHVDGIKKSPELYEPFPPEVLGLKRRLFIGAKSGRSAVKNILEEWRLEISENSLGTLVKKIRKLAIKLGRPLKKDDIKKHLGLYTNG